MWHWRPNENRSTHTARRQAKRTTKQNELRRGQDWTRSTQISTAQEARTRKQSTKQDTERTPWAQTQQPKFSDQAAAARYVKSRARVGSPLGLSGSSTRKAGISRSSQKGQRPANLRKIPIDAAPCASRQCFAFRSGGFGACSAKLRFASV